MELVRREGAGHAAAYLRSLDISGFSPKAPQPKTPAFYDIVAAGRAAEIPEMLDVLDKLENPEAVTLEQLRGAAGGDFLLWLDERKNRRVVPYRMEKCGYVPVRNDAAKDGLWKIRNVRQAVYARQELSIRDRLAAAGKLTG